MQPKFKTTALALLISLGVVACGSSSGGSSSSEDTAQDQSPTTQEKTIENLQQTIKKHQEQINEISEKQKQLEAEKEKFSQTNEKINQLSQQETLAKEKLQQAEKQLSLANSQKEKLEKELQATQKSLNKLKERSVIDQNRLQELSLKLTEAQNQLKNAQADADYANMLLESANKELQNVYEHRNQLEQERNEAEQKINEKEQEISHLKDKNRHLEAQYNQLTKGTYATNSDLEQQEQARKAREEENGRFVDKRIIITGSPNYYGDTSLQDNNKVYGNITADGTRSENITSYVEMIQDHTTNYQPELNVYKNYNYNLEDAGYSVTYKNGELHQIAYGGNPTRMTALEDLQRIPGVATYTGKALITADNYSGSEDTFTLTADFINQQINGKIRINNGSSGIGYYTQDKTIYLENTEITTKNDILEFSGNAHFTMNQPDYSNNLGLTNIKYEGNYEGKFMGKNAAQVAGKVKIVDHNHSASPTINAVFAGER
ncbi:factor H binding protein domain-containing protein [Avibacterium avium]|uniref:factor H binding protein domain-containing protein n=1 Tax=Avibacterium avium TaxID=751 RepID=UPI003BF8EB44